MDRTSSSAAGSNRPSASATPASSLTASTQNSSVLKSAFAPSHFQLHLFASVVQSFDSNQLRIHDTATGRLRSQHESRPGSRITCLDWGHYGGANQEKRQTPSKKKRKRDHDPMEGAVVAYGTTSSDICLFSPAEGKIVGTLTGAHQRGVRDVKFSTTEREELWSIGEDGKLVLWNLANCQTMRLVFCAPARRQLLTHSRVRIISIPDPAVAVLARPSITPPQILCASSTPFAVTLESPGDFHFEKYDSFKHPIHSLLPSKHGSSAPAEYFLAADSDRYMNIYNVPEKKLSRTLVAASGILAVDLSYSPKDASSIWNKQILAAVTKDGTVELFVEPFELAKQLNGDLKSSRKNLTKKATAHVRLVNSQKRKPVAIIAASLQGPDLVFVSSEGGVGLSFQKIRWQDEGNGELLFDGVKEVIKVNSASTLNTATLNGVKDMGRSNVDESRTVVVNGVAGGPHADAIEILSTDDDDDEEDSVDEADENDNTSNQDEGESDVDSDEDMVEANQGNEAEDEEMNDGTASEHDSTAGEPSFGEMLASRHPNEISIADNLAAGDTRISVGGRDGLPAIPSGMSLGTVLTQSLRTNDQNLLEACLHTLDISVVKNTIQRLDSSLAGVLLSKLAERLATRPGRYGNLITWVQWTCVAHGGAIAAQPDVAAKVRTLYQVLTQRSKTLDSLLLLKGKLDMLDAQLSFRKQLAAQRPPRRDGQDEPGMIYIEGEDNWESSDDEDLDEDITARPVKKLARGRGQAKTTKRALEDLIGDDESSDNDNLLALENGDIDSDDEDEEESDDDNDGRLVLNRRKHDLVDDEAEESDPDDEGNEGFGAESSSDDDSSLNDDEEVEEDDDEEDSEMDDFINDDAISFAEDEDDIHIPGDEDEDLEVTAPSPEPEAVVKAAKQKKSSSASTAPLKPKKDNSKTKSSRKHS